MVAAAQSVYGTTGAAMIAKIESGPANVDLLVLARATQRILDERHMLIAVQHSGAAAILARRGWDGSAARR